MKFQEGEWNSFGYRQEGNEDRKRNGEDDQVHNCGKGSKPKTGVAQIRATGHELLSQF